MPCDAVFPFDRRWPIDQAVQLACVLEASAPKVGNVHPGASFDDMHFEHFLASAVAIRQIFARSSSTSIGRLVLDAVTTTRKTVGRNTNLGTLLLFAPLAKAACGRENLRTDVRSVLDNLTEEDCRLVYQAIHSAKPGGIGKRAQDDIAGIAPQSLIAAMAAVADVDAVARQYTTAYDDIFESLLPWLQQELKQVADPLDAICRLQLRWLAHEPDGLIVRKVGYQIAHEVQLLAQAVLPKLAARIGRINEQEEVRQLDALLRADGHRRNPGTTADLIAATILVRLLES